MPIPEINLLINAFAAGAKAVNPQVTHRTTFIGTFFDPPKAREAGLALIDSGADLLFGERIGTADAAKDRGIRAIGSLIDYTPMYPDTIFANALWGFRPILNAAIADVAAGKPTGRDYTAYGLMKEGGSDIAYVKGMAPAEAEAAMEKGVPDIVLLDFLLGEGDPLHIIPSWNLRFRPIRVVILTASHNGEIARRALQAGAAGFVCKTDSFSELLTVVRKAARGS